jgi:hypothetical protein
MSQSNRRPEPGRHDQPVLSPERSKDEHDISHCSRDRGTGRTLCGDCYAIGRRDRGCRRRSAAGQAESGGGHAASQAECRRQQKMRWRHVGDRRYLRSAKGRAHGIRNELNHVPIDSWQIDNLVVSKISTFLSKSWMVQRISYPKGAFSSLGEEHGLFFNYSDELQRIVRQVMSSTKCSHYVVVVKISSQYGTTNQAIHGLGIVEAGTPLWQWDYIYALYTIRLYDGQTLAFEGQQAAKSPGDYIPTIRGPSREVDKSWWPQSNAEQSAKLREGIRSLVEKSLDVTMPMILRPE